MPSPASTVGSSIPELWATELQIALRKALRYANVCNRKYEGEIRQKGDTVRIQTVADISVGNYARNTDISLQTLTTTDQTLVVDQAKSYGFFWDLLDQTQTATPGIMREAASRTAYLMADEIDQYVAGLLNNGVATANILNSGSAYSVGTGAGDADAFELLVDLAATLTENNVPEEGRWAVIPPWYAAVLKKDPRRSSFGTPENVSQYGQGILGIDTVSGLTIWVSNNVPVNSTDYSIIAGYSDAVTFAEQVTDFKTVENPVRFGTNVLGMNAYGGKVTRPYGLAKLVAAAA